MGPSANCNNNPEGLPAAPPLSGNQAADDALWGTPPAHPLLDRNYTLNLTPALPSALRLDAAQFVVATIAFGAGSCGGHPTVESVLLSGSSVIANGSAPHKYSPGAPYPTVTVNMTVANTTLFGDQPLTWRIHVFGTYYGAGFLGVGDH